MTTIHISMQGLERWLRLKCADLPEDQGWLPSIHMMSELSGTAVPVDSMSSAGLRMHVVYTYIHVGRVPMHIN